LFRSADDPSPPKTAICLLPNFKSFPRRIGVSRSFKYVYFVPKKFSRTAVFLGIEVEQDRFEFLFDEQNREKLNAMANRNSYSNPSGLRRYPINRAYHKYLEVKPGTPSPQQEHIPLAL